MELRDDIRSAVEVLRKGGVILYPTDTVWGLGCDATNAEAVERIYRIKQRPDAKALITLVSDMAMLERHVEEVPEIAYELLEAATTPLTVIYDKARNVASNLAAADGSIAIRIPADDYARELCRLLRCPIVSTSANISGEPTPATFADIAPQILDAVDYTAMHRRDDNAPHTPSHIIRLRTDGTFKLLR